MTLYFAYGSNMNRAAMRCRRAGARAVGPAILEGHRFFVGIDGWGSVKPSAGDTVHGVLWRLTPRDLSALHAYELLHQGLYDVRHLPVRLGTRSCTAMIYLLLHQGLYDVRHLPVRLGTRSCTAMIYLLRRRKPGRPKPGYVEMIAASARAWNLPEPYIRSVERWSTSRWTGTRLIDAGELA